MAKKDENGNSMASAAAYQRTLIRQAEALWRFDKVWEEYYDGDYVISSIRVIVPGVVGGEFKAVVKATFQGHAFVAFHNAESLVDLLVGLMARLENWSLRFREDQYAGG